MRIPALCLLAIVSWPHCVGAAEAPKSDWVQIPVKDPNRAFFLDQASVHVDKGEVFFWDRIVFQQPTQMDEASGHMIKEKRILHRADCKTQEWSVVRGAIFDEQGQFLEALTPSKENTPRSSVKLGTVAALELAKICKLAGFDEADTRVLRIGPQSSEGYSER
jgi:hypothetical protein